jgi:hypothetical protein
MIIPHYTEEAKILIGYIDQIIFIINRIEPTVNTELFKTRFTTQKEVFCF